jgi:glutaminase
VLPGQIGVAVFSPRLDEHGNSVRGVVTSQRLSQELELHFVRAARSGRSTIRTSTDITQLPSGIRHPEGIAATLAENGHRARVIELNGDLMFAGTESTLREVCALGDEVQLVILDLRRVDKVGGVALRMLSALKQSLAAADRELLLIGTDGTAAETLADLGPHVRAFETRSAAVEYAENVLISRYSPELRLPAAVPAAQSPALSALSVDDARALAARMEPRSCEDGEIVRRVGQRFGGVFFIVSGRISTIVTGPAGERVKLTTLGAGMTFGELALGSDDRQETTEKADGSVELQVLTSEAIAQLELDDPRLAIELWKALTRDAYTRVDQYLRETAVRIRD